MAAVRGNHLHWEDVGLMIKVHTWCNLIRYFGALTHPSSTSCKRGCISSVYKVWENVARTQYTHSPGWSYERLSPWRRPWSVQTCTFRLVRRTDNPPPTRSLRCSGCIQTPEMAGHCVCEGERERGAMSVSLCSRCMVTDQQKKLMESQPRHRPSREGGDWLQLCKN